MLKAAGALLILVSAGVFGMQLRQRLAEHVRQLIGLKEMLLMLSGEMTYERAPLFEAFGHIAGRGKEPFSQLLFEIAGRMETERDKPLYDIWKSSVRNRKSAFLFSGEEFLILLGVGENFGYLDIEMQLKHIAISVQQVEDRIVQAQSELAAKQKMYQYLSVMCGLFLILILI